MDLQSLVERIGSVPDFNGMPEQALKDIVSSGQILHYPAGSIVFNEGEECAGMYVLLNGEIHLCKHGLQGQETIITVIKPVTMFNEVPVIDGGPNPVTAKATQNCTTWQLSCERFHMLMERYPVVGTSLLNVLATRNRLLLARYEDLLSRPVLARIAKILLDLSQNGECTIDRYRHSNTEIAAMSATVPEAVSRSIKTLHEKGLIDYSRADISVVSTRQLAEIAKIDPFVLMT